jgi:hypothetical protein
MSTGGPLILRTRRANAMRHRLDLKRVAVMLVIVLPIWITPSASASSTKNLYLVGMSYDDWVTNYDFNERADKDLAKHVDWGVTLIFWNNAEIDKVKEIGDKLYDRFGANKHSIVKDRSEKSDGHGGYRWDTDAGIKDTRCPQGDQRAIHFRIYAPGDKKDAENGGDRMYNPNFGFYVVATSHVDHNECRPSGSRFDGSEVAEEHIANYYRRAGYGVYEDWSTMYNQEPHRVEGNHTWDSNGRVTIVNITHVR